MRLSHGYVDELCATATQHTANVVLGWAGQGGYEPSGFSRKLLDLLGACDQMNRRKVGSGFPEWAAAYELYHEVAHGMDLLRQIAADGPGPPSAVIARGACPTCGASL